MNWMGNKKKLYILSKSIKFLTFAAFGSGRKAFSKFPLSTYQMEKDADGF